MIRKIVTALVCGLLFECMHGCTAVKPQFFQEQETVSESEEPEDGIDLNLAGQSSTIVYSEVYSMMISPEDYRHKTIRICGYLSEGRNSRGEKAPVCLIPDAAKCCAQGMLFDWKGDHSFPEDYPAIGEQIVIQGVFDYSTDGNYIYPELLEAEMEPLFGWDACPAAGSAETE